MSVLEWLCDCCSIRKHYLIGFDETMQIKNAQARVKSFIYRKLQPVGNFDDGKALKNVRSKNTSTSNF